MQVFNTMAIIILQYINVSNQHIGCLKLIQYVNYISINFKIEKKRTKLGKKWCQLATKTKNVYRAMWKGRRKINEREIEVTLHKKIEFAHDIIKTFSSVTEKIASKSRRVEIKNSLENWQITG